MRKDNLRVMSISFLSVSFAILIFILLSFFFIGMLDVHRFYINIQYDYVTSVISENDKFVQVVYMFCSEHDSDIEYVECIRDVFKIVFDYQERPGIIYPYMLLQEPADCLSSTVFYKTFLDMRGIDNSIHTVENHAYNVVDLGSPICIIDQSMFLCW